MTTLAEIIITDLNRNDGFIAFKEYKTKIIRNLNLHLHIVNVENIQSNIDIISHALNIFYKNNSTQNFHKVLERRVMKLSDNFKRLKPLTPRHKRGLVNPIGTIIKSITGNLDNNDLYDINKQLDITKTKTNYLIESNNRQIIINDRLQSKLNEITKHLNEQQIKILKEISIQINKKTIQSDYFWKQNLFELLFNIQFLDQEINDLVESVQLAKLGIICKNIISLNEMETFEKILTDQNITISSLDQIYEYLGLEVFHKNHSIIFVIKVPNFEPFEYDFINIELLPKNNSIITFDYKSVITNGTKSFVSQIPCYTIEKYKICNSKNLKDISEDKCISNALRGTPARCNFKEYQGGTQIDVVNDFTVILKDANYPTSIKSECNIKERSVTGTLLVSYEGCDITINNTKFSGKSHVEHHKITMIPMIGISFKQEWFFKEHNISQIQISNINHIEKIEQQYTKLQYFTIGGFMLTLSCSIIIVLLWLITRKTKSAATVENNLESNDPVSASISQHSNKDSGRIFSKDGVVTKPFTRFQLETANIE